MLVRYAAEAFMGRVVFFPSGGGGGKGYGCLVVAVIAVIVLFLVFGSGWFAGKHF